VIHRRKQLISHRMSVRMIEMRMPLERFFERIRLLGNKLGPVLYQLPPSLHKDFDLLGGFLKLLPKKPVASTHTSTTTSTATPSKMQSN